MRNIPAWIFLLVALAPVFGQTTPKSPAEAGAAPAAYDRTVAMVALENAPPSRIRESLSLINRNWGVFPSIQFLELPVPECAAELLFLRGRKEEVEEARRIAAALDRSFPPPVPAELAAIPLGHLGGLSMREKLLALSERAGLGLLPRQFLVFPPGPSGSLFFLGPPAVAKQLRELKLELDQPRHGSWRDLASGFITAFRKDFAAHFLTVSTYAAAALLLLFGHLILSRIPGLGKIYQRWFTLIWTRLIHDVKGRDFAYEVIKSLAETAVDSAARSDLRPLGAGLPPGEESGEREKPRAMAIARDLLIFRGFNPDDPEIKRIVSDLITAAVPRRRETGR